jgi:hypothetical protein
MTIERIHQEIKFRWNKLNSNHKKDFPAAFIDDAVNKATDDYVEIFYSGNNSKEYKFGFEVTQQRIDMLQTLVPTNVDGSILSYAATLISTGQYKVDLSAFSPKYRHFLRAYVVPIECSTRKIPVSIVRLNDLDTKLADSNTQPSLTWNRCLGSIKNNNLVLYTKDYTINSVKIEYLRNPVKVFFGGYNSLEFTAGDATAYDSTDAKVTSDLPEQYHDLLVDLTVQYIGRTLEDNNKVNLQKEQILNKV